MISFNLVAWHRYHPLTIHHHHRPPRLSLGNTQPSRRKKAEKSLSGKRGVPIPFPLPRDFVPLTLSYEFNSRYDTRACNRSRRSLSRYLAKCMEGCGNRTAGRGINCRGDQKLMGLFGLGSTDKHNKQQLLGPWGSCDLVASGINQHRHLTSSARLAQHLTT